MAYGRDATLERIEPAHPHMSHGLAARINPSAVLFESHALDCIVALVRYAPHSCIPLHAHEEDGVSVILDGAVVEETRRGEFAGSVGWTGLRPAREVHTNRFGPTGAYVLAVIPEPSAHGILPLQWSWSDSPNAFRAGLRFVRH